VGAVAFVRYGRLAGLDPCGQRRQDLRECGPDLASQSLRPTRIEARDILVERVDEDRERRVGLELGAAACKHNAAPPIRDRGHFGK
jgi:hypothetical protein